MRLERVGFFKNYEESIFPLIVFEISVMEKNLAYLEHISAFSILLAYDLLEHPVAPLSGASRPPRGLG